jgi:hypothetical protein
MPCGMFRIVRGGLTGLVDYPTPRLILKPDPSSADLHWQPEGIRLPLDASLIDAQ